ncbi:MAK10-like protein [Tanacetum coccineum]
MVKAIGLPQDVPSTSDHRLIELENQVQLLMEAHLTPIQPTKVNKITTSYEICSGPHNTQYCMEDPEQAFVEYASSRTDEAGGLVSNFMTSQDARLSKFEADFQRKQGEMTNKIDTMLKAITDQIVGTLPSDTVKNPKLGTHPVLSARSYPTVGPQYSTQIHSSINTITIYPKQQSDSYESTEENEEEERGSPENHPDSLTPPNPSITFITEKVLKFNLIFESLVLVPPSPNAELVCTKEEDGDVMFIEIISRDDNSHKEEPEPGVQEVEYFDIFPTMSELAYQNNLMRKLNHMEDANGGVSNFTRRIKGMHVFIGNFTYIIDFMIVEDISSIVDPRLSQVVLGRPFVDISNMTHDPPKGLVRFINGTDEVSYKMPHKIEQYDSLSDLEKEHTKSVYLRNEEDKKRGVEYVMSKILGFYKECLELGPEYLRGMGDEGEVTYSSTFRRHLEEIHVTTGLNLEKTTGQDYGPTPTYAIKNFSTVQETASPTKLYAVFEGAKLQAQHQQEVNELIESINQKIYSYGDVRSKNQDLLMIISKLKDELKTFEKGKDVNTKFDKSVTSRKLLCVTPLPNNIAVQAKKVSNSEEKTDRSKPVTSHSIPKSEQKQKKNANVIARGLYKIPTQESHKQVSKTNMNDSNSTGVGSSNSVRRPKSKDNKSKNRVLKNTNDRSSSTHVRKVSSSVSVGSNKRKTKNLTVCHSNASVINAKTVNVVNDGSNIVCVSYRKDVFMISHEKCVAYYALSVDSKMIQLILWFVNSRYRDYVQGKLTICHVYYVEGLGYNLFLVGQFYDGDLEVAFRSNTCYVRNLEGDDLLTDSRDLNLYTIFISELAASSPVCLMSKATSIKTWLWHQRLSHLNFGTINQLTSKYLVDELPKFKYDKDHLCSAYEQGKIKKASFPSKLVPSTESKLELLHMDLCGPVRVESINGKKYILVIVDDYSRYTWVYFLRTKDEAPDMIIDFINQVQRNLKA